MRSPPALECIGQRAEKCPETSGCGGSTAQSPARGTTSRHTSGIVTPTLAFAHEQGTPSMELVTKAEKELLEARLEALIANRPAISKRIAEARELGDLRENADYHAAREEQGLQEAEIRRLGDRLGSLQVVDEAHKSTGVVFIGATVRIVEVGTDDEELVRLVGESTGSTGGDVFEATISSPFGEALNKARVGETIAVRGPRGLKKFLVKEIV
jgi:transcription elongation factor GreA